MNRAWTGFNAEGRELGKVSTDTYEKAMTFARHRWGQFVAYIEPTYPVAPQPGIKPFPTVRRCRFCPNPSQPNPANHPDGMIAHKVS